MKKRFMLISSIAICLLLISLVAYYNKDNKNQSHAHSYGEWEIRTAATCATAGKKICSCTCGKYQTQSIPATGHTVTIDIAVESTCTTTGLTEGKHCSICNEVLTAQEIVPAMGHTEMIDTAVEATCTATGLTEGKHCSICNEVLTAQEIVPATGHTFSEWVETIAPTCTVAGVQTRNCDCGSIQTKTINATGHSYGAWENTIQATCTVTGTQKRVCICGNIQTKTINATGHSYGAWKTTIQATCTATGTQKRTCICGSIETKSISALGHNFSNNTCTRCSKKQPSAGLEFTSNGDGTCYVSDVGSCTDINVVIPETSPKGYIVTSIEKSAFSYCRKIVSVTLPSTLTTIGVGAFAHCSSLSTINLNYVKSIESSAFEYCDALTKIELPNGLLKIGSYAFSDCDGIIEIVIPDSVTTIGQGAFSYCNNLLSATIGTNVEKIYDSPFYNSNKLGTVIFKNPFGWSCKRYATNPIYFTSEELLNTDVALKYLRDRQAYEWSRE
ncbi:MAG: leucine-rich repeat domain-containing protein [Clostridia bacterium]|nr:leucine-rich repeat domain-containing protein [Clostridia bacterium]